MSKQAEAKRDGVINSQNYNSNQFYCKKFWSSQNVTNQPNSIVELGYMCPRGLSGQAETSNLSRQNLPDLFCFTFAFRDVKHEPFEVWLWLNFTNSSPKDLNYTEDLTPLTTRPKSTTSGTKQIFKRTKYCTTTA